MSTLPRSPLQFAVVREDPRIEGALVRELGARRILAVASGGCTALALRAWYPELDITLIEPNPAQVAHVERKLAALATSGTDPATFNVGSDAPTGLHECGNFERLFRVFRDVLDLFVVSAEERAQRFARNLAWIDVTQHAWWPVAFEVALADPMLRTMFGPAAVQHARPGSYPQYFQSRLQDGLAASDRAVNPWLHHVMLGRYLEDPGAQPPFLRTPPADHRPFPVIPTTFAEAPAFDRFDFVNLSNVLDWLDDDACAHLAARLGAELPEGAAILWRQLNDPRPLLDLFAPCFAFSPARDADLLARERSLFYDQVHLGIHR